MAKTKTKNKIQVHLAPGAPQFDISDFPKDAERSVKGATTMYFRQNTVVGVTSDELAHIRKSRPDMMKYITVKEIAKPTEAQLKSRMEAPKKAKAKAEADAKAEAAKAAGEANASRKADDEASTPTSKPNGLKEVDQDAMAAKGRSRSATKK